MMSFIEPPSLDEIVWNYLDHAGSADSGSKLHDEATKYGLQNHPVIRDILNRLNYDTAMNAATLTDVHAAMTGIKAYWESKGVTLATDGLSAEKTKEVAAQYLTLKDSLEAKQEVSRDYVVSKSGLPNLGNTCFMNASLQMVFERETIEQLLDRALVRDAAESEEQFASRQALQNDVKALNLELKKPEPSRAVVIQLTNKIASSPVFSSLSMKRSQEDANEFLSLLETALEFDQDSKSSVVASHVTGETVLDGSTLETSRIMLKAPADGEFNLQQLIDANLSDDDEGSRLSIEHENVIELKHFSFTIPRFGSDGARLSNDFIEPFNTVSFSISGQSVNFQPKRFICHRGTHASGHYTEISLKDGHYIEKSDNFTRELSKEEAERILKSDAYIVDGDFI